MRASMASRSRGTIRQNERAFIGLLHLIPCDSPEHTGFLPRLGHSFCCGKDAKVDYIEGIPTRAKARRHGAFKAMSSDTRGWSVLRPLICGKIFNQAGIQINP